MPKVELWDWVWKNFGFGGILSILLGIAVYALWKYVKKIHAKIPELHEKYNERIEKIIKENQDRSDEKDRTHEYRMDEMSRAYTKSIERVASQAHEDHVRMEMHIQSLKTPHA